MTKIIVISLISSLISTILVNPLEVIKINIQLGIYDNIISTIKNIYNTKKLIGFFYGMTFSIITIPSFWVVYFNTYEQLKNKINTSISAYIASNAASTVTAPLWFIKQKQITDKTFNIITHYKEYGIKPYFRSLPITYIINSNFIINIGIYEYLKNNKSRTSTEIYIISSFSKTISSIITYPLDTLRVSLRHQNKQLNVVISSLNKKGISSYYYGLNMYLFKAVPQNAIMFTVYEFLLKYS